jgi:hypothetical protein
MIFKGGARIDGLFSLRARSLLVAVSLDCAVSHKLVPFLSEVERTFEHM